MNIQLLITVALVLANLINRTVVNPMLNIIFGGHSKTESGGGNLNGSARSETSKKDS
jgi:hypothetical protein